jgi:hypothetical protein
MSLYLMDGYDHRSPVASVFSAVAGTVVYNTGFRPGSEVRVSRDAVARYDGLAIDDAEVWISGFIRIVSNNPNSGVRHHFLGVYLDGETTTAVLSFLIARTTGLTSAFAVEVRVDEPITGTLEAAPYSGTSFVSADELFPGASASSGRAVKLRILRGASDGSFELYLDDVMVVSGSGIPELALSEGDITSVGANNRASGTSLVIFGYDDLWVADVDYGDPRIVLLSPNGQGNYDQGTPSGGGNRWDLVNDVPPNDSEFITLDVGERESFTLDDTAMLNEAPANIGAIAVVLRATGPADVTPFVRVDGTDYDLTPQTVPGASVAHLNVIERFDPSTGGAAGWTRAGLSALDIGVRESS